MTNDRKDLDPKDEAARKAREPEHFPPVRQDDAVEAEPPTERRSFDPARDAPVSPNDGRLGPSGDPAEGKR